VSRDSFVRRWPPRRPQRAGGVPPSPLSTRCALRRSSTRTSTTSPPTQSGHLRSLEDLAELLARQVGSYGAGRNLCDDAGGDPSARLVRAVADVSALRIAVAGAVAEGERFWSAIGHIGLELDDAEGEHL
jgi:hypothetical protein